MEGATEASAIALRGGSITGPELDDLFAADVYP
jgi:hypothetical protein